MDCGSAAGWERCVWGVIGTTSYSNGFNPGGAVGFEEKTVKE